LYHLLPEEGSIFSTFYPLFNEETSVSFDNHESNDISPLTKHLLFIIMQHASLSARAKKSVKGGKTMYQQLWISIIVALIMAGGLYGVFYLVTKQNATLGIRAIQFLAVVFLLPLLIILGINDKLDRGTTNIVLGIIIGYVLSGNWKE